MLSLTRSRSSRDPRAAESGANCRFLAARGRTRHQKIGNVQTRDQEKASGGGKERVEQRLDLIGFGVEKRANVGCVEDGALGQLFAHLRGDIAQIGLGSRDGDAGLQLADDPEIMRVVRRHHLRGYFRIHRHPKLYPRIGVGEPGGQNADNGVGLGVEQDGVADDCRIASEAAFPETPGEDGGFICAVFIVVGREEPAVCGLDAEQWKRSPGRCDGVDSFGKLAVARGEIAVGLRC